MLRECVRNESEETVYAPGYLTVCKVITANYGPWSRCVSVRARKSVCLLARTNTLFRQRSMCEQMCKCVKKKEEEKEAGAERAPVCVDACSFTVVLIGPSAQCFWSPRYGSGRFAVAQFVL